MIKRLRLTALIAAFVFGGSVLALQLTRVALKGDAITTVQPGSRTSVGFKPLTEMTASDRYKGEDGGLYGAKRIPPRPSSTDATLRTLVDEMAEANPLWGAPRLHGEVSKLGIEVSERTVSRLLRRRGRPPSQTWRTFLASHAAALVSMDVFTVPTLTGRMLFVLVLLAHHRRRVVHLTITDHPTAAWTAQQVIEAFPDETAPRWLVRDRDAIYNDVFRQRVAGMGITEVVTPASSPWQNPYAKRLIGSLRRECLDHVIILSQTHLRRLLARYVPYYHGTNPSVFEKDAPTPRRIHALTESRVVAFPEVGGLHHGYERRAA